MPGHNPFTQLEKDFIIANFAVMTLNQLAFALGRSKGGVKSWALKLGLRRGNRFEWTSEKIEIFEKMYPNHSAREIAERLDTSDQVINARSRHSTIRKTPEYLSKLNKQMGENLQKKGLGTRFVKGHKPWSAGKQIGTRGRAGETQFKKGQTPHNTAKVGGIAKPGGYWKIKIAEPNRWEFLHLFNWKNEFGEVPKGKIIVFKDGNSDNYAIENLEALTRGEALKRHSVHNYPDELKSVIRTLGNLKRQINRRNKKDAEKQD